MTSVNATDFWQFSLSYYAKVKPICLAWQDDFNANVNLLLLMGYLEQQRLSITGKTLKGLNQALFIYNARFTQRVRALRRRVSNLNPLTTEQQQQFSAELKQQLLGVELVAEQQEQQLLVQLLTANTQHNAVINAPSALLELYLSLLQQPISNTVQQQLIQLRLALSPIK